MDAHPTMLSVPPDAGHGDRLIGAILMDAGRLDPASAERILKLQKDEGLRFGDAAVKLGLLSAEDIQYALAQQFDYPYLLKKQAGISEELVAAYEPFSPQVEALRAIRSQLMLRWFTGSPDCRALAIVSAGRGEGRSYLAANLAIVFSQLGERTLLIDGDMRHPRQHALFGLDNRSGLSSILSKRGTLAEVRRVSSFIDLSVLTSGPVPPNPQELLSRPLFSALLDEAGREFDTVIIDTPNADGSADFQTIASTRTVAALIVARKHETRVQSAVRLTMMLKQLGVVTVGSVLNQFRT